MKNKTIIKRLQQFDPDAEVKIYNPDTGEEIPFFVDLVTDKSEPFVGIVKNTETIIVSGEFVECELPFIIREEKQNE